MKTLNLDNLLLKPQPVELAEGLTLWIKPLTQVDRDLCQAYARRASRDLRKLLVDPETEEHQMLIVDELAEYNSEQLAVLWVNNRLVTRAAQIRRASLENRDSTYVPEPESPDLTNSELDAYEEEVEQVEEQREDSVRSTILSAQKELQEEVKEVSVEALREEGIPSLVENILASVWLKEMNSQMITRGTFLDERVQKPAFKTAEDARSLRAEYFDKLANAHYALLAEPEALKN